MTTCKNGVWKVIIPTKETEKIIQMEGVGIRRVTGEEAKESLEERQKMGIDPYFQGFSYEDTKKKRESVRLCFQVTLKHVDGRIVHLEPLLSNTISNTKCRNMKIVSMAPNHAICNKSEDLIILAEHLPTPGDTMVVFTSNNAIVEVEPKLELSNTAIKISSPALPNITEKTLVTVKLKRKSNGFSTDSIPFTFMPPEKPMSPLLDTLQPNATEEAIQFEEDGIWNLLNYYGLVDINANELNLSFEDFP